MKEKSHKNIFLYAFLLFIVLQCVWYSCRTTNSTYINHTKLVVGRCIVYNTRKCENVMKNCLNLNLCKSASFSRKFYHFKRALQSKELYHIKRALFSTELNHCKRSLFSAETHHCKRSLFSAETHQQRKNTFANFYHDSKATKRKILGLVYQATSII